MAALVGRYPFSEPWRIDEEYLCPSLAGLEDLPLFVPGNVTACGLILMPARPFAESDSDLVGRLQRRPSVLINLESHMLSEGSDVVELAQGVRVVLERYRDFQVLWKLHSMVMGELELIIGAELEVDGRVKIRSWLETDPISLLQNGHGVCSVHHGGANSFYGAIRSDTATFFRQPWILIIAMLLFRSGVPQVVLPVWYDTYDFANRVEYLLMVLGSSGG